MGRRKRTNQEKYVNGRRVLGPSECAIRLTERAKELGYARAYTRDAIYQMYVSGRLIPAMETDNGNLYFLDDVNALPIRPQAGRPSSKRSAIDKKNSESNDGEERRNSSVILMDSLRAGARYPAALMPLVAGVER